MTKSHFYILIYVVIAALIVIKYDKTEVRNCKHSTKLLKYYVTKI